MPDQSLPADWQAMADGLAKALASVQQLIDRCPPPAPAIDNEPAVREASLGDVARKLEGLPGKATGVAQGLETLDAELRGSEEALRELLTQTETVRQRLADWASRAIG